MRPSFKIFLTLFILLTISAVMLSLSWQKWPDTIVDFGKELYVPWQISNGSVLYRDMAYFLGPFSPYLHALLFKVFGIHLMTLVVFNIILVFVLTFLIYRIFFITTDWITATLASAVFLSLFAFSQYARIGNYNFVCPYTYNLTHGVFLAFLLIDVFLIYLDARHQSLLFVMGGILGLVFLTKVEVFLAGTVAILVGIFSSMLIDKVSLSKAFKMWGLFWAGFFIPTLLFLGYFSCHMSIGQALTSIIFPYTVIFTTHVSLDAFYAHMMGIDHISKNILKMLWEGIGYVAIFVDFALIGYSLRRLSRHSSYIFLTLLGLGVLFFFKLCSMALGSLYDVFRPLPIVVLVFGAYLLMALGHLRKDFKESNRLMGLLVMSLFSFLLILKMGLNVHLYQYGFALAMPATLLLVGVLVHFMPVLLGKELQGRVVLRILSAMLLGVILMAYMNISKKVYSLKSYPVSVGSQVMYDFKPRGAQIQMAIMQIEKIIGKKETFIAFPEGAMLNYLTGRVNPSPYLNFMPTEMISFGENKILASFMKNKPDYMILVHRNLAEYGCGASSDNCGNSIVQWIIKNYTPLARIGDLPLAGKGFGMLICKRNL